MPKSTRCTGSNRSLDGDLLDRPTRPRRPSSSWCTCPYCGEPFETSADASAGLCSYVEDCQICCQPIEMELRVDDDGHSQELVTRRGDS